jgi:MinD superfamily P-loop ATPase
MEERLDRKYLFALSQVKFVVKFMNAIAPRGPGQDFTDLRFCVIIARAWSKFSDTLLAMPDIHTLVALTQSFGEHVARLEVAHCLNRRHKAAACRLCADACPVEAIRVEGAKVVLDQAVCAACGLCLWVCPTGAFDEARPSKDNLAELLPGGALELVCPPVAGESSRAPVTSIAATGRCLAALSPALLLELACGERELWLNDAHCAACVLGAVQPYITASTELANRWLSVLGFSSSVHTHLGDPDRLYESPVPRQLVHVKERSTNRRGFLGALRQAAADFAGASIDQRLEALPQAGDQGAPYERRLPQRLPREQARLMGVLAGVQARPEAQAALEGEIDTTALPLAAVSVDAALCTACAWCARFCPTGALAFLSSEQRFGLYFRAAMCVGCGVCAVACPEDALGFAPRLELAALLERKPRELVSGELAACSVCRQPTAVRDDESPRCYVCRRRASAASLRSEGLRADLFTLPPTT